MSARPALAAARPPAHDDGVGGAHALDLIMPVRSRPVGRGGLASDDALGVVRPVLGFGQAAQ
jgi:hypothetical protein